MSNAMMTLNYPLKIMKFRLVYEGDLPAEGRGNREVKQRIRRCMHAQIKELLAVHPSFKPALSAGDINLIGREWDEKELTGFATLGAFVFASLVSESHYRSCHLDILLLRRAPPGGVFHSGDIDNRIKTLIDGLRAPQQTSELPPAETPQPGEHPFYCLLSDDRVISGFSIRTDQLLTPMATSERSEYARVIIEVSVQVSKMLMSNLPFLTD